MAHAQHHQQQQEHEPSLDTGWNKTLSKQTTRRLARHGSLQPQENDQDDEDKEDALCEQETKEKLAFHAKDGALRVPVSRRPSRHPELEQQQPATGSLLPVLERICSLTRQIASELKHQHQQQQDDGDSAASARTASLYCERGSALVRYAHFDVAATIPLALLQSIDPTLLVPSDGDLAIDSSSTGTQQLKAVSQALEDALAAIALDPEIADAYLLASQCSRSLGIPANAMDFARQALRLVPHSKGAQTLMKELTVDLNLDLDQDAPPLLCRCLDDSFEPLDAVALDIQTRFQAMELLTTSPLLVTMEQTLHECRHHQCASSSESIALQNAMDQTVQLLCVILKDTVRTSQAILIDRLVLDGIAQKLSGDSTKLVTSSALRQWLIKTLTPAVVQSLPDSSSNSSRNSSSLTSVSHRAAMLRDVLLTLARLLLATGNWQRCMMLPHAHTSIKMAYDLTKRLTTPPGEEQDGYASTRAKPQQNTALVRLELACADAYAVALLDMGEPGEAILLHQQSLDFAIQQNHQDRILKSHFFIGRALLKIHEYDAARDQFERLVKQSARAGHSAMECLGWFQLGECWIKLSGGMMVDEHAMEKFEKALLLSNQTAQCHGTWRQQSMAHAMAFYGSLRAPVRRRAMPRAMAMAVADTEDWMWPEEIEDGNCHMEQTRLPRRRATVWMTTSSPLLLATASTIDYVSEQTPSPIRDDGLKAKRDWKWRQAVDTTSTVAPVMAEKEEVKQQRQQQPADDDRQWGREKTSSDSGSMSLMGRLIGQASLGPSRPMHSPTRPACWKRKD